jgi:hypothetical protein
MIPPYGLAVWRRVRVAKLPHTAVNLQNLPEFIFTHRLFSVVWAENHCMLLNKQLVIAIHFSHKGLYLQFVAHFPDLAEA